jgi:hypothetical protein
VLHWISRKRSAAAHGVPRMADGDVVEVRVPDSVLVRWELGSEARIGGFEDLTDRLRSRDRHRRLPLALAGEPHPYGLIGGDHPVGSVHWSWRTYAQPIRLLIQ